MDLSAVASGDLLGTYSAGRDAALEGYGVVDATVTAGRDITELAAVGDLHGSYTARRNIFGARTYGSTDAVITADGTYEYPPNEPVAQNGFIGAVTARGELGGAITAAGGVGPLAAGGAITATVTRGDGGTTLTDPFDPLVAAQAGPAAPTPDWLADLLVEAQAEYNLVAADMADYRADLAAWRADMLSDRAAIAAAAATDRASALQDKADTIAALVVAEANLDQTRADIMGAMAALTADLAAQYASAAANLSAARSAAQQDLANTRAAAAQSLADALAAINQARSQASTSIDAQLAQARTALAELVLLQGRIGTQKQVDNDKSILDRANEVLAAQARLTELTSGNAVDIWNASVQAKIDQTLDYLELVLSVAGLVPGLGAPTSALSALISAWRGNWGSAALSLIGIIPALSTAANAVKITRLGVAAATRLSRAAAALSRIAKGAKALLEAKKLATGANHWKAAYATFDFVFCKALHLACFTAGTPIEGEHGPIAIEQLKDFETHGSACDRVLSRNEDGAVRPRRVLRRFERRLGTSPRNDRVAGVVRDGCQTQSCSR